MRRARVAIAVVALLCAAPAARAADPAPYGLNDAGGFRNVLPAGENGLVTATGLAANLATGALPPHYADQLPLYRDLVYASPTLTHDQIPSYFKDATFGVPADQVASVESPAAGLSIVRDRAYGVPHIYGDTRAATMFGAGYAGAEDRLFLMDVLRHTARGSLSAFAGGSPSNRAMDEAQWAIAPYDEADLQRQVDLATQVYGAKGTAVIDDVRAFVDGINAYIERTRLDPRRFPPSTWRSAPRRNRGR